MFYSDPPEPIDTPAETPTAKKVRMQYQKHSFPPNKQSSYGMAITLIGVAASSAIGIENPLHRVGAIIAIVILIYFIGLRTPT